MRKILLLALIFVTSATAFGQDFSNKGMEFWTCFPNHIPSGANGQMTIWITSDQASSGTVSITNGSFSTTFSVAANGIVPINIPYANAHISNAESGLVIQKSIKIKVNTGQPPVVAYAQQYGNARSAATLLLPTSVLGKKYRASSFTYTATSGGTPSQAARSQFQIIATQPNTQVEVTPYSNGVKGTTFTIVFPNIGDMYQYQATTDVTGTLIESIASGSGSCLPIAVFSGSSAVTIGSSSPNCNGASYDPLFQQCYPITSWGKNYGFIPFGDYTNRGNPFRIMAAEDNTTVSIDGAAVATLNAGQVYGGAMPTPFTSNPVLLNAVSNITADKPISVAHYLQTSACSGSNNGDPDMVLLNPIEQNIKDITVFASTQQNINRQWINVLIPTAAAPTFKIDGLNPTTAFQPAPTMPGYSYLRHMFTPAINGSHYLTADSGFNAILYGYQGGNFESYAYSAGTNVKDLTQAVELESPYGNDPSSNSICTNSPFRFKIYFPDASLTTPPIPVRFDSLKWDFHDPSVIVPNNFPIMQINPTIDSTTTKNGRVVNWYSLPGLYYITTPGYDTLFVTAYRSTSEGCGNEQIYPFPIRVFDPPVADFTWTPGGCVADSFHFNETTPQLPKPTYKWWWRFGDPGSGVNNDTSNLRNPAHLFSAPGTYTVKYAAITTPGCLTDTISKTVVVPDIPNATINANTTPVCINSSPPVDVTFTATEGTPPFTFTYTINAGAPQTINTVGTNYSVIIQHPTNVAGSFIYNVTQVKNTGSTVCVRSINQSVTVTIIPDHTINLNAGTPNASLCINTVMPSFSLAIGGGATGIAAPVNLPPGITATLTGSTVNIAGTPTVAGTYNYSITTTGNACLTATFTGTITVNPDHSIALNGGNANPVLCINTVLPSFTFLLGGGATGITAPVNLPPGVTATVAGNIVTVAGTPTVAGTYNYSITTSGNACLTSNVTGTIIVNPDHTIAFNSGNANPTLCINTVMPSFSLTIGGGATGIAAPVNLPPGITATLTGSTVNIAGTPTIAGTYNYSITTTGNTCLTATYTGTITVNPDHSIALNSGNANPTLCINTVMPSFTFLLGGGATGITAPINLPAGVTATVSGNTVTVAGTPTTAGIFNYSITTSGNACITSNVTGTITVNPDHTIGFNGGTPNPTLCVNTIMPAFTLVIGGGATNIATPVNLPPGVTASVTGNIVTISGTPTLQGTYNYSITTTGNACVTATYSNTIIVTADATLVRTSAAGTDAQELCRNSAITTITYDFGGSATGATVTGLPAGVTWSVTGNTVTIVGAPTVSSPVAFTYTVNTIGPCVKPSVTGTILVNALPTAAFTFTAPSCETRDIIFTDGSTANVGALDQWNWVFGDPASGPLNTSNLQNPAHIYATPGAYTVTLSVRNNKGCISNPISTTVVNINNRPVAGFIVPDVCINDVATVFTDTSKIAAGTINRPANQWNYGDPGSGPLNNSVGVNGSHLYTSTGVYQVRQIVTSSLGCKDTIVLPITINSADPVSNFTATNPCSSDSIDLRNLSTVGFGNVTRLDIYWDFVGSPLAVQTINSPAFNGIYRHKYPTLQTTKTYTIRMIAYSGVICSNTSTKTVTVYATPRVQFNNIPNTCYLVAPFQITQGSEIGGVPGTGTYSGPGITNPSGTFNPQIAGIGTHNIKYTWTASNPGACIDTLTKTITVLDTAHASFSVTLPSCEQVVTSFTDLSTSPASVTLTSTVWNFGDATGPQTFAIASPIGHTYANPGTYTVTMHNVSAVGCLSTDASMQVTIDANHHITLNAGGGNPNQTVCINTAITPITYTLTGGATGATVTGLPAGVTSSVTGNTLTISGTPTTSVASPYNFNIITTGNTCVTATSSGIITVNPDHAISLNGGSNSNQTVCINTAIAPIIYTLSGGASGATVTGLPPGVTASVSGNLLTINGTPTTTVSSPYNFSISTTGNSCIIAIALGSITVLADHTISLNAGSNTNQTVCINVPVTPIVYAIGGGATGATVTGLPAGINASVSGNQLTISGAPTTTVSSPFNYSVITTGNVCIPANASGSITVLPDHEITRVVANGDSAQSVCVNTAIDAIVYNLGGGATGATALGLPPGVTGVLTGNIFTISGTPTSTAGSPYNFTIQTSGNGCLKANTIGKISVNPYPIPDFAFDKASYCIPNATVGFINNTTPAPLSNHTYAWDFGDGGLSSAVSPSHYYTSEGPFTVTLKARSTVLLNGGVIGCESSKSNLLDIIHPQPKADFVFNKPSVCKGDNVLITDATDNKDGLPDKWHWDLGDGTIELTNPVRHTFADTITYTITMYSTNRPHGCNSDTVSKTFTVYPYPHVNAGSDKFVLEGGSVELESSVFAIQPSYSWTPVDYLTDARILRPRVMNPKTDMTYRLTVTGKGGCQLSDDVFVKLLKFPTIPNTFTPNGDRINDEWRIDYLNTYPDNRVQIFTRAGKLVFESKGYSTPWDGTLKGKPLPFDTYYYIIEPGNGRDPITGYVTILK